MHFIQAVTKSPCIGTKLDFRIFFFPLLTVEEFNNELTEKQCKCYI